MKIDRIEDTYHYGVVRRAIDRIDAAGGGPLSLDALAADMQMSPAHFQRVFSAWAGVSPKKLQEFLALGHAKALLDKRMTTLATSDAVGLSGGGRLHDLFLRWESMSPGDYAKGGAGLQIGFGFAPSPFGEALVMMTERGICGLAFCDEVGRDGALADMQSRWPRATYTRNDAQAADQAGHVFARKGTARLVLIGAPFQIKVWEALMQVPTSHVTTYGAIAEKVCSAKAARAVGTAVGRNPISWLIPCHRALRKTGGLGGYHWGLPIKRAMLAWESAQDTPDPAP